MAAGGGPGAHPCCGTGGLGTDGGDGRHGVLGVCADGTVCVDRIVVTTDRLVLQRSKGSACYKVLRDHLRFRGLVRRALARGHPVSSSRVRRGDRRTAHPGT